MRLTERRVLVTGGASGIGLALARSLATENRVVVASRDEAKLEGARAAVPALETLRLDVTDERETAGVMSEVEARLGGLDVLINGAGVMHAGPHDGPHAQRGGAQDVEVNLVGTIRATRLALPMVRASDEGAVVMFS